MNGWTRYMIHTCKNRNNSKLMKSRGEVEVSSLGSSAAHGGAEPSIELEDNKFV
jgi:hypothetical protein